MNVAVILFEASSPPADMPAILEWLAGRVAGGDSCHVTELRGLARDPVEVDGVTYHRGSAYAPIVAAAADLLVITHPEGLALAPEGAEVWDATEGFDPAALEEVAAEQPPAEPKPHARKKA